MVDFEKFDRETLHDTFRLLDDFNEEGFNWRDMRIFSQPADEYIENFFSRKKSKSRTEKLLSSLEPSLASTIKTALDAEDDIENDVFSFTKNKFRRSESSYSTTSGYETSSSNETISEGINSRRRDSERSNTPSNSRFSSRCSTPSKSKYSPSSSASTPLRNFSKPPSRARTYSNSKHDSDLSKKFEKQFMKDERHSMPHEIYSERQFTPTEQEERPHSVPVNSAKTNDSEFSDDDSMRFFPGVSMNSSRDSLSSEPLDRFMSRLSSFSSASSRSSSVFQDGRTPSSKSAYTTSSSNYSDTRSAAENLPDVLKGDPNGPTVRHIPIAMPDKGPGTWSERQGRIEDALKWLRTELVGLRAQDKVLLSQLKQCHDTIEDLKKQRSQNSDDEEEEGHWEDWEIAEFEKRYAENPELAEDLFNLKAKKSPAKKDVEATV